MIFYVGGGSPPSLVQMFTGALSPQCWALVRSGGLESAVADDVRIGLHLLDVEERAPGLRRRSATANHENGGAKLDHRAAIRSCLWAE